MTTTMTKERYAKMHPYTQYTVRNGKRCIEVSFSGLTEKAGDRLTDKLNGMRSILRASTYLGAIYTTSTQAADDITAAVERMGGKATKATGKATFEPRGYYDDQGHDFVAM